jgi:DNA-binding transcriptional regulator YhcF (GntR family)
MVLIRVDTALPEPLYEQLASGIRASIVDGRIAYGERLPSARTLGESLGLNLHTVLRAYRMLRDERMIELHPGRGAVVAVRLGHHTALAGAIHDLVDEARLNGIGESALLALVKAAYR